MTGGQGKNICIISAALMTGGGTLKEISAALCLHPEVVDRTLRLLALHGLAYRKQFRAEQVVKPDGSYRSGPKPVIWAWNAIPHQYKDFQGPK